MDFALTHPQKLARTLREKGIRSQRVLEAMAAVPRHEFVRDEWKAHAYEDRALPVEGGQTISQPYVVALMTEQADVQPGDRVLEIGTGSGYQTAVLSRLAGELYTVEIIEALAARARRDLGRLGLASRVHFRIGDGYHGWAEAAPFDAIVVTAAPPRVPEPLEQQLAMGGRLVIPVGAGAYQHLRVFRKTPSGFEQSSVIPVRFVPMTGRALAIRRGADDATAAPSG